MSTDTSPDDLEPADCSIERVDALRLTLSAEPWPFAEAHRQAIERHWACRSAENPGFWDGEVLVLRGLQRQGGSMAGVLGRERFSAFLYWRDFPALDPTGLDAFGTGIVRSAEGHVLVGRAAARTLNAGRIYLPGGFLDPRDRACDGSVDVAACAARELAEEIGLDVATLRRVPGIIVATYGRYCCFAAEWRSTLGTDELLRQLRRSMARHGDQELNEIDIVRRTGDLDRRDVIDHARFVVRSLLAGVV